jgi:hypothetical protein
MLKNSNNRWTIVQQILPRWIPEIESQMHEAIEDELQKAG